LVADAFSAEGARGRLERCPTGTDVVSIVDAVDNGRFSLNAARARIPLEPARRACSLAVGCCCNACSPSETSAVEDDDVKVMDKDTLAKVGVLLVLLAAPADDERTTTGEEAARLVDVGLSVRLSFLEPPRSIDSLLPIAIVIDSDRPPSDAYFRLRGRG
jgi:hypothetical protein